MRVASLRALRALLPLVALSVDGTRALGQTLATEGGGAARPALFPLLGNAYSVGYGIGYISGMNAHLNGTGWIGWWDPPVSLLRGRVTYAYDPTLITIRPEYSGFVGPFSDDPTLSLPYNPSGVYPLFDVANFRGARPGLTWTLTVGTNTVTLDFDLSSNPLTFGDGAEHVNMFGLYLETSRPLSGWGVERAPVGAYHEVEDPAQTFGVCADPSGGEVSCGGDASTPRGLTPHVVPEPTAMALLGVGLACIGGPMRRRLGPARSPAARA